MQDFVHQHPFPQYGVFESPEKGMVPVALSLRRRARWVVGVWCLVSRVYIGCTCTRFSGSFRECLECSRPSRKRKEAKHRVRTLSSVHWFPSVGGLDEVECSDGVPGLGPWIGVY